MEKDKEVEKVEEGVLTSGGGLPCPEHSMSPPELLENSTRCGGSWRKIGPCRSSPFTNWLVSAAREERKEIR